MEAIEIRNGLLGSDNPLVGELRIALADLYLDQGRFAHARQQLEAAEHCFADHFEGDHPHRLSVQLGLGTCLAEEDPSKAVSLLRNIERDCMILTVLGSIPFVWSEC